MSRRVLALTLALAGILGGLLFLSSFVRRLPQDWTGDRFLFLSTLLMVVILVIGSIMARPDFRVRRMSAASWLLHCVAHCNRPRWTTWLLDHGARVDAPDEEGFTPLMRAAAKGRTENAELLLARGANPNATSRGGWTALAVAAAMGREETVRSLLRAGADPNRKIVEGYTPLGAVCADGKVELVQALLEGGADPELLLTPEGGVPENALSLASWPGHGEVVRLLLDHGADLHALDCRAFMAACAAGHAEIVRLFLDRGADPSYQDADGDTPHGLAVAHPAVTSLLREAVAE